MKRSDYNCPECEGSGEVVCPHCEVTEEDCDACVGTGLDPDKIDVDSFRTDSDEFTKQHGRSWDLIVDGQWLGRAAKHATLSIEPYLLAVRR